MTSAGMTNADLFEAAIALITGANKGIGFEDRPRAGHEEDRGADRRAR
jgi:hypothetical protein